MKKLFLIYHSKNNQLFRSSILLLILLASVPTLFAQQKSYRLSKKIEVIEALQDTPIEQFTLDNEGNIYCRTGAYTEYDKDFYILNPRGEELQSFRSKNAKGEIFWVKSLNLVDGDIALDNAGNIYSIYEDNIEVFDKNGGFLRYLAKPKGFFTPENIVVREIEGQTVIWASQTISKGNIGVVRWFSKDDENPEVIIKNESESNYNAAGIAVGSSSIYVGETAYYRNKVSMFDLKNNRLQKTMFNRGSELGEISDIHDLYASTTYPELLYVADAYVDYDKTKPRVQVFNTFSKKLVGIIEPSELAALGIKYIMKIAVDKNGAIYIHYEKGFAVFEAK